MLPTDELASIVAGAALAVVMGLRRPPPLVSALLLIAIALLGLGLAYALGVLATVGIDVIIMDMGYVAGLTASLVRDLTRSSRGEAGGELGELLVKGVKVSGLRGGEGDVIEVKVLNGGYAPLFIDRGPVREVATNLASLTSVMMKLSRGGQVIRVKAGSENYDSPVKLIMALSDLEELTQLLANKGKGEGTGEIKGVKLSGKSILIYKNGKLAYIIPINQ